jgi:hypothetical protein
MRLSIITIILSALLLAGCGASTEGPQAPREANKPGSNAPAKPANSTAQANVMDGVKKTEDPTTNKAESVAPVIAAYYDALKKKDEAALRKVLSQAAIREWEALMKEDKKSSLVSYIAESELSTDDPLQSRNEKIEGETATADLKGGSYGVWTRIKFIKENGAWKFAAPSDSPEFPAQK